MARIPGIRVLVVEDDAAIADLVASVAEGMGFAAQKTTGAEVESIYAVFQPHILVLDIIMPDKDGLEVLQFLRTQASSLRIIILSGGHSYYTRFAEHMGTGCGLMIEACIAKPFRLDQLRETFSRIEREHQRPASQKSA